MTLIFDSKILYVPHADVYAPRIGAENLLRSSLATVTASADTTDGEKENAYSEGFTFDFWRPGSSGTHWLRASFSGGAQKSNYVGIAAHNLHQHGGVVKMQHSVNGGAAWSDSSSEFMPGDSSPIMILYDDTSAGDHRLVVVSTGAVSIGAVFFGEILKFNAPLAGGWIPPYLGRSNRYVNDVSEGGAFLGRALISEGARLSLRIRGADLAWLRDKWEATVRIIEQYPFFFAARDRDAIGGVAEAEVFYGWITEQPQSGYGNNVSGFLTLNAQGIIS